MKNIFASLLLLISSLSFSQMAMAKLDGTPINNGDVFTFNVATDPDNYLGYKIYNNSSNDINVKVRVVSFTNATGSNLQLCIGPICVNTLVAGNVYPSNFPVEIPANGQNGNFDHFLNNYTNGQNIVEYVLKFFQVDASNNEIGNSITITYRYNPTLATPTFDSNRNSDISIKSTLVTSQLDFEALKNGSISIFDVNGKLVKNASVSTGIQEIDVSSLSSNVYLLNFVSETGNESASRFIKK